MSATANRVKTKGVIAGLVQSVFSAFWGGAGAGPRETYAGQWQIGSTATDTVAKKSPLAYSAVYTCINNIASDISKLPMRVMRPRVGGGGNEVHLHHPLMSLFKRPNNYQTMLQFLLHYLGSKLWTGNAYVFLIRNEIGIPISMHVLDPTTVTPAITDEGDVWYLVKENSLNKLNGDQYIPARNIVHDRATTLFHPLIGVSPLYAAGVSASIGNNITSNSDAFFSNMSRSSGTLSAPGDIPPLTAERLKAEWANNYRGLGFGKVAVLGAGIEWKPLTMTAVDAQLIEQLRFTVEDIGRVYRVPSFMLGETKMTYKNSEQLARYYFQGCLSHHIEALEQCFNRNFEMTKGSEVQLDLSPLFRMETDLRYDTHSKALTAGIKSINEVRAEEDLPPVKGGEEPRMQMQYIPLSMATQAAITSGNAPGAAPAPTPEPEDDEEDDTEDEGEASAEFVGLVNTRLLALAQEPIGV